MDRIIIAVSTVCYLGYSPRFTGILGSSVGLIVYFALSRYFTFYTILVVSLLLAGIYFTSQAEILLGEKDSQKIIIDEVVGYLVATHGISKQPMLIVAILGFVLFRFFDRKKFWMFKYAEKIEGGLGIMLDDVLAGLVSNLIIRLVMLLATQMAVR